MGDWGKRIKIAFTGELFNVNSAELITKFRLCEVAYSTYIYPIAVTYGASHSELYLEFDDINQINWDIILEYLGGTNLGSADVPMDAFTLIPVLSNLNRHGDYEYVEVSLIEVSGEMTEAFDGTMYENEYVEVSNFVLNGTYALVTFYQRMEAEYLQVSNIVVAGSYCDINGIPL